jgi:hypothetical protein
MAAERTGNGWLCFCLLLFAVASGGMIVQDVSRFENIRNRLDRLEEARPGEKKEPEKAEKVEKPAEAFYGELATAILTRLGDRRRWEGDERGVIHERGGRIEIGVVSYPFYVSVAGKNVVDSLNHSERSVIYQESYQVWRGIQRENAARSQKEALEALNKPPRKEQE